MVRCAESDPQIAIVNPLSNMCVNLSVPMVPGLNLNTMAAQVERRSRRRYPDITTAVGFCMLIKRRYLDWLGGFDEVYGRGYCEESDMCMRYTEAGLLVTAMHVASFFANFAGGMAVDISGRRVVFLVGCLLVGGGIRGFAPAFKEKRPELAMPQINW